MYISVIFYIFAIEIKKLNNMELIDYMLKQNFDQSFDEWTFLEVYMTDYYHSDYIAWIDDIDCVLNGEKEPEDCDLENCTKEELINERNRMMRIVLEDAFKNYIELNYGKES